MERGAGESSLSAESVQPETATSSKTSRESETQDRSQVASGESNPTSSVSILEEVQRQLGTHLASFVQNTVEKETKELLKQILRNSERQITLLKARLADSWRDPDQTAQLRTTLRSEEPWLPSNEALVNISIGGIDRELHKADPVYALQFLRRDVADEKYTNKIASAVLLAVWGFGSHIINDPDIIGVDLEALRITQSLPGFLVARKAIFRGTESQKELSQSSIRVPKITTTNLESLRNFITRMWVLPDYLRFRRFMDIRLERGGAFIRLIQPYSEHDCDHEFTDTFSGRDRLIQTNDARINNRSDLMQFSPLLSRDLARLMICRWDREQPSALSIKYFWGLDTRPLRDGQAYGEFVAVKAPSISMGETFMSSADMAMVIAQTAVKALGGLEPCSAELAIFFLLSFACRWKAIEWQDPDRLTQCDWQIPEWLVGPNDERQVVMDVLTLNISMRTFSPIEADLEGRGWEGIQLSRVVGGFANIAPQQGGTNVMEMTEKRVSIWLTTNLSEPHPTFQGLCLSDASAWTFGLMRQMRQYSKDSDQKYAQLFSATSVREATRGTNINEYILVFTVMTITYLPLGFVATLYGIDMFNFDMPGQTTSFAITTVVVSLGTYLAAWGLLYGVRQRRKKGGFGELLSRSGGWFGPAVDMAKHIFNVGNSSKQAAESASIPEVEVRIDEELPPEPPEMDERKGNNKEKTFRKRPSDWNVFPGWITRRRQYQEASV
ncbi:hypothetical protein PG988_006853 [Apiospora saccharicola]